MNGLHYVYCTLCEHFFCMLQYHVYIFSIVDIRFINVNTSA